MTRYQLANPEKMRDTTDLLFRRGYVPAVLFLDGNTYILVRENVDGRTLSLISSSGVDFTRVRDSIL